MFEWLMLMREQREEEEETEEGGERWAVVFDYNKMLHLVSLILQLNGKKHREDC